jgi:hypothetical protein
LNLCWDAICIYIYIHTDDILVIWKLCVCQRSQHNLPKQGTAGLLLVFSVQHIQLCQYRTVRACTG